MAHIEIRNLNFAYPKQNQNTLEHITLDVNKGEFLALCGTSGSGKTTLLRLLKPSLSPFGTVSGEIRFRGEPLDHLPHREEAALIGFVQQNPDAQLVTDKVWHELAFGLESLGADSAQIRRRAAEMANFFGIEEWFYKDVADLSGGQKQLLNLASVMTMQPEVLILDEPTSQLDPIAASDFLTALSRLNRELGVTVLISEHRLEEVLGYADRAAVLEAGRLICADMPARVGEQLRSRRDAMFAAMPAPMRIWSAVPDAESAGICPVTVWEGRNWMESFAGTHTLSPILHTVPPAHTGEPSVTLRDVWFRYEKDAPDILRNLSFSAWPGEIAAILGGNGAGKSTTLLTAAGLNRPYRGSVKILGGTADAARKLHENGLVMLPQDPQSLFTHKTVREELEALSDSTDKEGFSRIVKLCRLEKLLERHPYDLSGGEQQCAALAMSMLKKPSVLLLDEPTKGLDAGFKKVLAGVFRRLAQSGMTLVMISHDIEFCAETADRCALLFDGQIAAEGSPAEFFSGMSFYTTSANRMARSVLPDAVTADDVIRACGGKTDPPDSGEIRKSEKAEAKSEPDAGTKKEKPRWKRILSGISLCGIAASTIAALLFGDSGGTLSVKTVLSYGALILFLILAAVSGVNGKSGEARTVRAKRKISKRTAWMLVLTVLLMPVTIFIGIQWMGDRKYYFISLLLIVEALLPSLILFENRKPQAREIVLLAVMCAIGVAGRAAFFMLPSFKPVLAIVIISGVAFGGEMGFLVGATTAMASNFLFGQGPWTPWQMFAFGICGLLAGMLYDRGILSGKRAGLTIFGALAAFFIYGGIMNPASVLMFQNNPSAGMFWTAYLTGLPSDLIHACATACFLWFFSEIFLEKLERVRTKYGMLVRNSSEIMEEIA